MAKRMRYKTIEKYLTYVLLADTAVFALFLLFSGMGLVALKVITALLSIVASGLSLAYLYMIGETKKRRSLWIVLGFLGILLCLFVSLILNYPAPAIVKT